MEDADELERGRVLVPLFMFTPPREGASLLRMYPPLLMVFLLLDPL